MEIHGPGGDQRGNTRFEDPTIDGQICGNKCLMHRNAKQKCAIEKPKLDKEDHVVFSLLNLMMKNSSVS